MRAVVLGCVAFLAGLALGWLASMVLYIIGNEVGLWHDRDGGIAMGFAFTIGPVLGLVAGIVAAIFVGRRARRRVNPTS